MSDLLDPRLVTQLSRHRLTPRQRVRGRFQGAHRSTRLGASVEFADVREYVAGDDPRRVDLAASRRHGRLQVLLTEAEDDAASQLVLDRSASMHGGKAGMAARLAAGLAVLGARDGVRVWTVERTPDGDRLGGGWARGSAALAIVGSLLGVGSGAGDAAADTPGRPDVAAAVRRAVRSGTRGPLVVISDLLFDGWEAAVLALGERRRDAIVLQVLARDELEPAIADDVRLVDVETGDAVDVGPQERVRERYAAALAAHLDAVATTCAQVGASHLVVAEDADVARVLLGDLAGLGHVR